VDGLLSFVVAFDRMLTVSAVDHRRLFMPLNL
jgi:hypothetical protein